jgi:plastocyanin
MLTKRLMRRGAFALAAAAALVVASTASAHSAATVTISHQMRGCHEWSYNAGPMRPSLSTTISAGTVVKFVNNDVMPHKLIQLAGPRVRIPHANMKKMSATTSIKVTRAGVYRFTTKAGEDYPWASSMHTKGEDHVLRLTLRVK